MALTFTEIEAVTNDYFMADGRKAVDIYFDDCFLVDYLMKKQKGIWKRYSGGKRIRIPLSYDGQEGGFYTKASTLSSDDVESVNAAFFYQKHAYGNATIHRNDELENAGPEAEVDLVVSKVEGAQKTARKYIGSNIYSAAADGDAEITGLRSCCFGADTVAYGGIVANDLVATDASKPWIAKDTTTSESISLAVIRTLASSCKIGDGPKGKPDLGTMPEALFNIVSGILQVQQRFTQDQDTAKAGFTHLVFEGKILASDDYVPSGYLFLLNTAHIGFAIHTQGYFARTPWGDLTPVGTPAKTMKIFWDGNLVVNNRRAHAGHSNLS